MVVFSGPLSECQIPDAFAACDTFLFPNEEQTWGLTAMEAMNQVAPAHNPPYIKAMRLLAEKLPEIPLVAAFETL